MDFFKIVFSFSLACMLCSCEAEKVGNDGIGNNPQEVNEVGSVPPPDEPSPPAEEPAPQEETTGPDLSELDPEERAEYIVDHIQQAFDANPVLQPLLSLETKREEVDVIGVNLAWQQLEPQVQELMMNAFGTEPGARILFTGPQEFRSTNALLYLVMLRVQGRYDDDVIQEYKVQGPMTFVPEQLDERFLINGELGQVDFNLVQSELMATELCEGLEVDSGFIPKTKRSECIFRTEWTDVILDDAKPDSPRSYKWRLVVTTRKAIERTYGQWTEIYGDSERMEITSEFQALLNDETESRVYGPMEVTPIGLIPKKEILKARSTFSSRAMKQEEVLGNFEEFQETSGTFTPAEFLGHSEIFRTTLRNTHSKLETTLIEPVR